MAETLTLTSPEGSEIVPIDLETFRSRLKELQESRLDLFDSSETSISDRKNLIEECASDFLERIKQIEAVESSVASLGLDDLDAFFQQLKQEISFVEEEDEKISTAIGDITKTVSRDLNQLEGDVESLAFSLNLVDSQGVQCLQARGLSGSSFPGDIHEGLMDVSEDHKFEIWELSQQIESRRANLSILQDLDFAFKRYEAIDHIEDNLSVIKVLEFEGNCIRLLLKTPLPSSDSLLLKHKLDCVIEPSVLDHELLIEVADKTLELHKLEIFPNDVSLDDIIHKVKSTSHLPIMSGSTFQCLVGQVQYRIVLCTLRCLLVEDANKSRYSFDYSDRDEMITAHLIGGIDAAIKIASGWPISSLALNLVSVKNSNVHSRSISLSFLCKVQELANSLDNQIRCHLTRFIDAIEEILVREMQSELHAAV